MMSNGKQFTVRREMLTAVARDQSWTDVAGISARFSKFAFVLFCYFTRRIFAFTRALSWRETLFLLHVLR